MYEAEVEPGERGVASRELVRLAEPGEDISGLIRCQAVYGY
jgi:hypothetical protein